MYYIDFDNTLYETGKLTRDILDELAKIISTSKKLDYQEVLADLRKSFNSTLDNFNSFAKKLTLKYGIKDGILQSCVQKIIILKGSQYVFPDALNFLKKLKEEKEKVCILTYVAQGKNLNQQSLKLAGSGILPYVTEVYNTTRYKFELEINYKSKSNIFIDDSPRDLEGFYNAGARKLIRIKKPSNEKRTSKELNIPIKVPTFENFNDICNIYLSNKMI